MSERASDGVSSEVKPLGAVELLAVQAHARYFAFHGPDHTFTSKGAAAEMLRLCATIRQLEGGLVAVTAERDKALRERDHWITRLHVEQEKHTDTDAARTRWLFKAAELERERDAYKAFVDAWLCDRDPAVAAQVYMEWRAVNGPGGNERWVAAVEALWEIADLEDKPQPSGNSGGFAAAAGILADTWDGEKPEDTIRRMRDGAPARETTQTIVETRMGEPNAIDAEEET